MVTAMDEMTRNRYLEAFQLFGRGKQYIEIRILPPPPLLDASAVSLPLTPQGKRPSASS